MDDIARLPPADLADLFRAAAARRGLPDAIVEKDFWVCWTLKRIFTLASPPAGILFKGGTSLSKVYGVIDRFSEDVDLSFDRAGLGFGGADDPMVAASGKKQTSAVERLAEACTIAVREKLRPQLAEAFAAALGTASSWSLELEPRVRHRRRRRCDADLSLPERAPAKRFLHHPVRSS